MDDVVFVEIPSGSRNKYEWDTELGAIVLDRRLFTSMSYPADYGYIEGTLAEDGDPLDALVLVTEPTFPGCRLRARPVGVLLMHDDKGPDVKILCVALGDPHYAHVEGLDDVPAHKLIEVEHFFATYKLLEDKHVAVHGWSDLGDALDLLRADHKRWLKEHEAKPGAEAS